MAKYKQWEIKSGGQGATRGRHTDYFTLEDGPAAHQGRTLVHATDTTTAAIRLVTRLEMLLALDGDRGLLAIVDALTDRIERLSRFPYERETKVRELLTQLRRTLEDNLKTNG